MATRREDTGPFWFAIVLWTGLAFVVAASSQPPTRQALMVLAGVALCVIAIASLDLGRRHAPPSTRLLVLLGMLVFMPLGFWWWWRRGISLRPLRGEEQQ